MVSRAKAHLSPAERLAVLRGVKQGASSAQLAQQFDVHPSTIRRIKGCKTPAKAKLPRGRPRILSGNDVKVVKALVDNNRKTTVDELAQVLPAYLPGHQQPSRSTIHRVLQRELSYGKKQSENRWDKEHPLEVRCFNLLMSVKKYTHQQLVFTDESGFKTKNLHRQEIWCEKGKKYKNTQPTRDNCSVNIVGALGRDGIFATKIFSHKMTSFHYMRWFRAELLPSMNPYPQPRSVLIIDNFSAHDAQDIITLCAEKGVKCHFLPRYTPRMNAIELCWAILKNKLPKVKHYSDKLPEALNRAISHFNANDNIKGLFEKAGYLDW